LQGGECGPAREKGTSSHEKQDHGLGRNYLQGAEGDRINALLAGAASI
jgi:hypothetical protein